ncbi:MAG: VTT domain-containing protein [Coriobacteriales bacterium]|jgi:membrane-associated protein|nr:VTT domain-containing protein [Coriobacteriales bacterium]
MPILEFLLDLLRDPRSFIADWINQFGPIWVYAPLALILFIETGVVFMPFLPGDSLLFAAGVFATSGGGLNIIVLITVCSLAAILGDTSNYWIGRRLGSVIIASGKVKSLTPERMEKTQSMLDRYGSLAVVLARFFPFIRTFAPFLAGFGHMRYPHFMVFNAMGGILWVNLFTLLGYFFGGIPFVQDHFEWVVIAIVVISLVPAVVGLVRARLSRRADKVQGTDSQSSK